MSHTCNRRQFLKGLAGVAGGMALSRLPLPEGAHAASVPAPHMLPARRTPPESAQIAFVKTTDRAAGVQQALALLEFDSLQDMSIFVKPNYNSADPAPGSTHNDVLRATVEWLGAQDAGPITVGDRSGMGHARTVMESAGVFAMAEELGFDTVVFEDLNTVEDWEWFQVEGGHWQQGFPVARPALDADGIVNLCCLKTHRYGGHFTLSLKNSVGMVAKVVSGAGGYNYMNELHGTVHQRRMIAEINAAYDPALVVMDGVEAFVNGGPARGDLAEGQVILAGTDRVAMDALGVALLRYLGTREAAVANGPIFAQEQTARAVALGLGVDGPEKIDMITDDPASAEYAAQIQEILLSS